MLAGDIGVGMEGLRWAEAHFPLAVMLAEPFDGKTVVVTHHAP